MVFVLMPQIINLMIMKYTCKILNFKIISFQLSHSYLATVVCTTLQYYMQFKYLLELMCYLLFLHLTQSSDASLYLFIPSPVPTAFCFTQAAECSYAYMLLHDKFKNIGSSSHTLSFTNIRIVLLSHSAMCCTTYLQ